MTPDRCSRCGTPVTSGLRMCVTCALRFGEGPVFSMQIAPQKRPPYEQQPTPPQGDTDATSTSDDHP